MKNYKFPQRSDWPSLCLRPTFDFSEMEGRVGEMMKTVKANGDSALIEHTKKFDGVELDTIVVDISNEKFKIDPELADGIRVAKSNIEKFHLSQREEPQKMETMPGVSCWRKSVAVQNVGLYIPGGSAPLFSTLLMLAIPAKIAGCKNIVVCTPPNRDGRLNEVIGWTCKLLGIEKIYLTGGAQAIAAMTFGTETIRKVDKIFGPGNQYVTAAKQIAQKYGVAIDMPAGPSEVLVIADDSAFAEFVAADLLSQAEHGADSQVVLVSNSEEFISVVASEINKQVEDLPRKVVAKKALENSQSILVENLEEAVAFSNEYAPEHLIIATENCDELAEKVTNAGSIFLGNWSCESAGDYASGTNHTLPTNGYARNYSGVSLDSFVKKITFQKLTEAGINNLGPSIEKMAEAEQLKAHKNAVSLRLEKLSAKNLPLTPSKRGNSTRSTPPLEGVRGEEYMHFPLHEETRREEYKQIPLHKISKGENSDGNSPSSRGLGGGNIDLGKYNHYNKSLKSKAKKLRNDSTIAEATLWKYVLRASGLGHPFKRQRPIGNYIVDFVSLPIKLIIEVDGITHSYDEVAEKGKIRQNELEKLGFTVIRISDDAILSNVDRVRNYLLEEFKNLPLPPSTR